MVGPPARAGCCRAPHRRDRTGPGADQLGVGLRCARGCARGADGVRAEANGSTAEPSWPAIRWSRPRGAYPASRGAARLGRQIARRSQPWRPVVRRLRGRRPRAPTRGCRRFDASARPTWQVPACRSTGAVRRCSRIRASGPAATVWWSKSRRSDENSGWSWSAVPTASLGRRQPAASNRQCRARRAARRIAGSTRNQHPAARAGRLVGPLQA